MVELSDIKLREYTNVLKPLFNDFVEIFKTEYSDDQQMMADLVYMLQRFVEGGKATVELYRQALTEDMAKNGVSNLKSQLVSVSSIPPTPSCVITDEALLAEKHPELMRKPIPDKISIAKLMRAGEYIDGATLTNGGPNHLRIVAIPQKPKQLEQKEAVNA